MTDHTDLAYPPPPPPMPRKARASRVLAVAGLTAVALTGFALLGDRTASPPATTVRQAASPQESLRQWVADYGARSAAVIGVIEGYSSDIAYYAGQGDLIEVLSLCRDGARYMVDASLEPLSLSPDAPVEWSRMVDDFERGMSACADGDLEIATTYIASGTDAMRDLTERLRQL